jgi:hypothetical protein
MATFTETIVFDVHDCPTCGVQYAAPQEFFARKNREDGGWYCVNGHAVVFKKSALQKAKEDLARVEQDRAWYERRAKAARDEAEHQKRRAAAARGQVTKIKNRIANGVCPCCNRHFVNVERHIKSQHPDFAIPEGE